MWSLLPWRVLRRLTHYFCDILIYATLSNVWLAWCGYRVLIVTLGIEVFKFIDKWFICYYFTSLLEVHTGPCTSACFYPRSTCCLDGLHNLVLRFPERPFSGLVGQADPTTVKFTPTFWRGWNLSIGFVTRCIPNTSAFWKKLEESDPFLRVPTSSFYIQRFPEEAPNFPEKIFHCIFRASCWGFPPAWYINHLISLRYYFRVSILLYYCLADFFGICLYQKVPSFLGAPKFLEVLIRACEKCPGKSSPCLIIY